MYRYVIELFLKNFEICLMRITAQLFSILPSPSHRKTAFKIELLNCKCHTFWPKVITQFYGWLEGVLSMHFKDVVYPLTHKLVLFLTPIWLMCLCSVNCYIYVSEWKMVRGRFLEENLGQVLYMQVHCATLFGVKSKPFWGLTWQASFLKLGSLLQTEVMKMNEVWPIQLPVHSKVQFENLSPLFIQVFLLLCKKQVERTHLAGETLSSLNSC